MSANTKISWCDASWNPWIGCEKVSAGCKNCFAAVSTPARAFSVKWGGPRRRSAPATFNAPLRWNQRPWICDECGYDMTTPESKMYGLHLGTQLVKCPTGLHAVRHHRRRVFALSLGDWLDADVPTIWLVDMLNVIRRCPNLDFLLLTKRPENWSSRLQQAWAFKDSMPMDTINWIKDWVYDDQPPPNVWLGVSVEDQESADQRIPLLLETPAALRFVSFEPALGPVDFHSRLMWGQPENGQAHPGLSWLIIGGESGTGARPFDVGWARETLRQCRSAGVACFIKQLGSHPIHSLPKNSAGWTDFPCRLKDRKGADPTEWPAELRVREFPTSTPRPSLKESRARMVVENLACNPA